MTLRLEENSVIFVSFDYFLLKTSYMVLLLIMCYKSLGLVSILIFEKSIIEMIKKSIFLDIKFSLVSCGR